MIGSRLMLLALLTGGWWPSPGGCSTVWVGSGSPDSCTNAALDSGISRLDDGDVLKFDCGKEEHTIGIRSSKWLDRSVDVDGGKKIILDGQYSYRHFILASKDTKYGIYADDLEFNIRNIKLINGRGDPIAVGRRLRKGGVDMDNPVRRRDGGSIYLGKRGTLVMTGVTVTDCKAMGWPIMKDPDSPANYVTLRGGALYLDVESSTTISFCSFSRNVARQEGGAIYARWNADHLTIYKSEFYRNMAQDRGKNNGGGAIFVHETHFSCNHCAFRENRAHTGGAIRNMLSDIALTSCIFSMNKADYLPSADGEPLKGGGLYVDGCLGSTPRHKRGLLTIVDCVFEENTSQNGGGAYICLYKQDKAAIIDTKFCGNHIYSKHSFPVGAGLQRNCEGKMFLEGITMGGNTVSHRTNDRINDNESFNDSPGNAVVRNSDIPGIATTHDEIQVPPGITCRLQFCSKYPQYCPQYSRSKTSTGTADDVNSSAKEFLNLLSMLSKQ